MGIIRIAPTYIFGRQRGAGGTRFFCLRRGEVVSCRRGKLVSCTRQMTLTLQRKVTVQSITVSPTTNAR
jgi:hypothetical protein